MYQKQSLCQHTGTKQVHDVYQKQSSCQYTDTRVHNVYQTQSSCQGSDMRKVQGVHQTNLSTMLERERIDVHMKARSRFTPPLLFLFYVLDSQPFCIIYNSVPSDCYIPVFPIPLLSASVLLWSVVLT